MFQNLPLKERINVNCRAILNSHLPKFIYQNKQHSTFLEKHNPSILNKMHKMLTKLYIIKRYYNCYIVGDVNTIDWTLWLNMSVLCLLSSYILLLNQTSILTYIEDEPLFVASILSLFYSNLSQKNLFCCI